MAPGQVQRQMKDAVSIPLSCKRRFLLLSLFHFSLPIPSPRPPLGEGHLTQSIDSALIYSDTPSESYPE